MVIGLLTAELHFPENGSLKNKRRQLQRLVLRLKQKFNVSVAEVGGQDLWQRSTLAVACVNTSGRQAESTLARALDVIADFHEAELLEHQIELR